MKYLFIFSLCFSMVSCTAQNKQEASKTEKKETLKPEKNEDGEWELLVFDARYETFLSSRARPKQWYTEETLKSRNTFLVSEWNSLFMSGKHRDIIESFIEYDPKEKYGLEFEYRLYQVFVFVQFQYGLRLNGLPGRDWL